MSNLATFESEIQRFLKDLYTLRLSLVAEKDAEFASLYEQINEFLAKNAQLASQLSQKQYDLLQELQMQIGLLVDEAQYLCDDLKQQIHHVDHLTKATIAYNNRREK